MGIVSSLLSQSDNKMKFLLVLALAAYTKAEAEADPGFAYTIGHAPALTYAVPHAVAPALTYAVPHAAPALTYAVPHVYTVPTGCQNSEGAFVPCAQGSYFGVVPVAAAAAAPAAEAEAAPAVVSVEKREAEATAEADAEADPEADPWLYYSGLYGGHGYGYSHYAPLTYSYAPYTYSHGYCMAAMPAMDMVLVMDMPMPLTPMLPTITHSPTSMAAAETTRVVSSHAPEDKLNIDLALNLSGFCHINCALNK